MLKCEHAHHLLKENREEGHLLWIVLVESLRELDGKRVLSAIDLCLGHDIITDHLVGIDMLGKVNEELELLAELLAAAINDLTEQFAIVTDAGLNIGRILRDGLLGCRLNALVVADEHDRPAVVRCLGLLGKQLNLLESIVAGL